jgi:hypothetical protein
MYVTNKDTVIVPERYYFCMKVLISRAGNARAQRAHRRVRYFIASFAVMTAIPSGFVPFFGLWRFVVYYITNPIQVSVWQSATKISAMSIRDEVTESGRFRASRYPLTISTTGADTGYRDGRRRIQSRNFTSFVGARKFANRPSSLVGQGAVEMGREYANEKGSARSPFSSLDHCVTYELCVSCIESGFCPS